MRTAYFDCFSGAAGDMIVGSLLDAGADFERFSEAIGRLHLQDYKISSQKAKKQGLSATSFSVSLEDTPQPHRHLKHVVEIIKAAGIDAETQGQAIRIFTRLAEAEAKVHGTSIEKVHFHEVGAVDAIIDIVGACIALKMLGVEKVICSPIPVGSGTIRCEHGVMPVPAPATAELLKSFPIAACDETGELTTPTGAAILTTLARSFGPLPAMNIRTIGFGAGHRDGKTRPNVLRVIIGDTPIAASGEIESLIQLESNIDDATPQIVAHCAERLLAAGALDAWTQPIVMKKQRSGVTLCVLCRMADASAMEQIVFLETPTLGIRRRHVERTSLSRRMETLATKYGDIRMKIGECAGVVTATPEYEDCRAAATTHDAALREVLAEANSAWRSRVDSRSK